VNYRRGKSDLEATALTLPSLGITGYLESGVNSYSNPPVVSPGQPPLFSARENFRAVIPFQSRLPILISVTTTIDYIAPELHNLHAVIDMSGYLLMLA